MKRNAQWIPIAIAVAVIAVILLLQTRTIEGTFTVYPGQNSDGPVSISGVVGNTSWTFVKPIITIDTSRRVHSALILVNASGTGSVSAISRDSVGSKTVTLWDSNWAQYERQVQIGSSVIETRNLTVESAFDTGSPEQWLLANIARGTTVSDPDRLLNWSRLVNKATPSRGPQNLNYQLRGTHRLVVYANDSLTVDVVKQDFNMYTGEDNLTLVLTDLVSGATQSVTVGDDGYVNLTRNASGSSHNATFTNLSDSIYELRTIANSNGSDYNYNLSLSNGPAVFMGQVFALSPINLTVLCSNKCILKASTYHDRSRQAITVNNQIVNISNRTVVYNTTLTAGQYRVVIPKGNIILSGFNQASVEGSTWTPYVFVNTENGDVLVRNNPIVNVNQAGFTGIITLKGNGNVSVSSMELTLS